MENILEEHSFVLGLATFSTNMLQKIYDSNAKMLSKLSIEYVARWRRCYV